MYGTAVYGDMHAVIETPTFLRNCRAAGMSDDERLEIIDAIAAEPRKGDLIPGTGGARKRRFPGRGKGASGGYRTVSYYAADDVPVLLLALINKGERADLPKAEQNALRALLSRYAETYREGVIQRVQQLRKKS
jgi:hypothetical protein